MTRKQRLERLLSGQRAEPPLRALWKHFPIIDRIPRRFIDRTIAFQEEFQWDFVKLSFNGLYSVEDWCPGIRWPAHDQEVGVVEDFAIKSAADWFRIEPLNPRQGALGRERYVTIAVVSRYRDSVPVLATIFSPLTTAIKMCGDSIFAHMQSEKGALHRGLEVIAKSTVDFVEELVKVGVDGFFFATQLADEERMSPEAYKEFGTAYDRPVVEAMLRSTWFNIFHLHGMKPMFHELERYPFQAVNYHDRRCGVPLAEARKRTAKVLVGGIDEHGTLKQGQEESVRRELKDAFDQVPDGKVILGPGCVVPLDVHETRFRWVSGYLG